MKSTSLMLGTIALASSLAFAQSPPTPSGMTVVTSKVNKEVKLSFKQMHICETTPGVKSHSGYVHIPGSLVPDLGGFDINTYFMYFEARHNAETAPLAVYLAGGPGEASSYAALNSESGPCYVNPNGTDTTTNPWSFNTHANMLYIDQPNMVGFSYSHLINGTYNTSTLMVTPEEISSDSVPPSGYGTFSDQTLLTTSNTTVASAKALWYFVEHWFSSFPEYQTSSKKISLWGNSYAGFYIPQTAATVSRKLEALSDCHPLKKKDLKIDVIGITNGCIDFEYQMEGFPEFANNNTYGVKFYDDATYQEVKNNITKPGGCLDLTRDCRQAGALGDPDYAGNNETVNELCIKADLDCAPLITLLYQLHKVSTYDVAIQTPGTCAYYLTAGKYLNTAYVLSDLGVPLNWTWYSLGVTTAFGNTGDAFRQSNLPNLGYLIDNGVRIVLVHGDRDYTCPWTGGESLAKAIDWTNQEGFLDAGYEQVQGLGQNAKGAVVKQYGRLSFVRVFDSGHAVSAYAPETVFTVFNRTMFGEDVVTGTETIGPDYCTTGPTDSHGWANELPAPIHDVCMVEGQFLPSNIFAAA